MPEQSMISRTLELFERRERRELFGVTAVSIVVALFEVSGIASIAPFLTVVADPDAVRDHPGLARLWSWVSPESTVDFLFILGVVVLGLVLLTNVVNAVSQWMIQRFTWRLHHRLGSRLLDRFLRQPWSFYLDKNTSELGAKVLSEVGQFVGGVVLAGMQLLAQSIAVVAIVALLFAVDPVLSAMVTTVVGGAYALVSTLVRKRQRTLGNARQRSNQQRFRYAAEAMSGIKDIKVHRLERAFVALFERPSQELSRAQCRNSILAMLPRYLLETLGVGMVMVILLYELRAKGSASSVIPIVGLYAFAGLRLFPKMQLLYSSTSALRFNAKVLDELRRDLLELRAHEEPAGVELPPFEREFGLEQVMFQYPNARRPALRDVTIRVERGSRVALVGSTGSGKTTCVDLLLGLMSATSGDLVVDGRRLSDSERTGWRLRCGYVPQHIFIADDTVAANIAFGVEPEERDMASVRRAAKTASLDRFVEDELPHGYDTLVGERGVRLSGGERQRLGIARALYRDPEVLVFDEATSALDGATEAAVMNAIDGRGGEHTMILVTHRLPSVRHCDTIVVLDEGRVVSAGTWEELLERCETFRRLAGPGVGSDVPKTKRAGVGRPSSRSLRVRAR